MGEVFAGRYELVDPLASGGAGVIWRVWDLREREYRAGKVLKQSDSASLLRFMRETSWRINHPHVVTPLGWVGEDDRVMFTMPLVRGGSLSALIKRYGPLPPRWSVQAIDQLLDALEKVHGTGLVHRDIKPANILLQPTDENSGAQNQPDIRLSDFGIAAPIGEPRMTRVTEVIGTPGYMSPEAEMGLDPDPKQDLWAVGVVLLEMLTGQRPPKEGPPVIPEAAARIPLGEFIARLLTDENDRIATATEARQLLKETPLPGLNHGQVVIHDEVPPLPEGWGWDGPQQSRPLTSAGNPQTPTTDNYMLTTLRPATGSTAQSAGSANQPLTGSQPTFTGSPPSWTPGSYQSADHPQTGYQPVAQPHHYGAGWNQGSVAAQAVSSPNAMERIVAWLGNLGQPVGWSIIGLGIVFVLIGLYLL